MYAPRLPNVKQLGGWPRYLPPMPAPYRNATGVEIDGQGVLRWTLQRIRQRPPRPPQTPLTPVPPDLALLHADHRDPTVTWIGHASLLVQIAGVNILVDPVFSRRVSPVAFAGPKRHQPPGLTPDQLPHIHVVVISHNHFDHLDRPSVRRLQRQPGGPPTFVVPERIDTWFARNVPGVITEGALRTVHGIPWHGQWTLPTPDGDLDFHFLPVQHWSSRSALRRNETPWGSWAMVHPSFRFWFSGDLGYSHEPREIGERFGGFDCAAIGIGAYAPRWFMARQHIDPTEAVQVMLDVGAAEAIGIHWGTFPLSDESLDEPPRALAAAVAERGLPAERFTVLRHGETKRFARRGLGQV